MLRLHLLLCCVLTGVDLLELGRGEVVASAVKPAVVVPVDPLEGGQFDVVEAFPRSAAADHLGLEQPDLAFGERVVERVTANSAHTRRGAGLSETLGERNRRILPNRYRCDGSARTSRPRLACRGPDRHLQRTSSTNPVRMFVAARQPQDPAGEHVEDERDVDGARPRRHIRDVGYPQGIRRRAVNLRSTRSGGRATAVGSPNSGAVPLPAHRPGQAEVAHQPLHRAPGHRHALTVQRQPHLAGTVDAVVALRAPA